MKLEICGEMPELAEGARLEIVCPAKSGTEGSNPSLSATKTHNWTQMNADFQDSIKRQRKILKGFFYFDFLYLRVSAQICVPIKIYDSRVLRNGRLPTPSGPEGSSGRNCPRVPQGSLAIIPQICGRKFDEFVRSLKMPFSVIPAKAGIQFFQVVLNSLDSGFHRSDDFLRDHQILWETKNYT
jgi:hypothetical protein